MNSPVCKDNKCIISDDICIIKNVRCNIERLELTRHNLLYYSVDSSIRTCSKSRLEQIMFDYINEWNW